MILAFPQPHANAFAALGRYEFHASVFKGAANGGKVIWNRCATTSFKTSNGGTTNVRGISQLVLIPV
jgi:hypothetical protein